MDKWNFYQPLITDRLKLINNQLLESLSVIYKKNDIFSVSK